jgi:hypothetical protein
MELHFTPETEAKLNDAIRAGRLQIGRALFLATFRRR